jgi:hypothetical protein
MHHRGQIFAVFLQFRVIFLRILSSEENIAGSMRRGKSSIAIVRARSPRKSLVFTGNNAKMHGKSRSVLLCADANAVLNFSMHVYFSDALKRRRRESKGNRDKRKVSDFHQIPSSAFHP